MIFDPLRPATPVVTFYHDVEQDLDSRADPEVCRRVLRELLRLERRLEIRVTCNVAGLLLKSQPEIGDWIAGDGHELAFHSFHHWPDWNPDHYADEVRRCRESAASPRGYRSPRSQWDAATLDAAWEQGFLWSAEYEETDAAYFVHEGLVRLPVAGDDWGLQAAGVTAEGWVRCFRDLLRARRHVAFGAHDCVVGARPEERVRAWEAILRAARREGARMLPFGEAAALHRREAVVAHWRDRRARWHDVEPASEGPHRLSDLVGAELGGRPGPRTARCQPGRRRDRRNTPPDGSCDLVVCALPDGADGPRASGNELRPWIEETLRIARPAANWILTLPLQPEVSGAPPLAHAHLRDWTAQVGAGRVVGELPARDSDGPGAGAVWVCAGVVEGDPPARSRRP